LLECVVISLLFQGRVCKLYPPTIY
jgi:hypothetical protein